MAKRDLSLNVVLTKKNRFLFFSYSGKKLGEYIQCFQFKK